MSKLYVDEIAPKTIGGKVIMPSGGIIQVQYAQKTDTDLATFTAETNTVLHTDLQVNITPSSISSKIKLDAQVFGEWNITTAPHNAMFFFYRDSIKLGHPASGNRLVGVGTLPITYVSNADTTPEFGYFTFFDTPNTTSAITYKIGVITPYNCGFFINRCDSDADTSQNERGTSFICATEIAG